MIDVVEPKKERTSKKLNLGNCKENSGDEIFRILSEMTKQRREIIDRLKLEKRVIFLKCEILGKISNFMFWKILQKLFKFFCFIKWKKK